ncbi:hypothetical protein EIN_250150 [Entamoeba invadens IP1]|uniref:Uncharacterized protein n=1 Tax=Entamoeba invadens IP1 TaxID=370355 RepID=A0A0A1UEA0_ENTIV|nr:hypothetical protein EIN_250150 [Entamoeba invadens IP1]ELP94921.1 hypothetical protein EIN_250150 [Entamoeba invadens IP1]|eukprot:XP_004261692.1 hypothetical protein EIN_250150 [Entamoeba invadens IP1]
MESIVAEHRNMSEKLRAENCLLREKASRSLGELMVNTRNNSIVPVAKLIDNETEIEALTKQLQINAIALSKQTRQWTQSIKNLEDTLNELGNLEIVGKTMETNLNEIDNAVRKLVTEKYTSK